MFSDKESIEFQFQARINFHELDQNFIAMIYTYILSGAIFAIGFKYAGTGNRGIFQLFKAFDKFEIIQNG